MSSASASASAPTSALVKVVTPGIGTLKNKSLLKLRDFNAKYDTLISYIRPQGGNPPAGTNVGPQTLQDCMTDQHLRALDFVHDRINKIITNVDARNVYDMYATPPGQHLWEFNHQVDLRKLVEEAEAVPKHQQTILVQYGVAGHLKTDPGKKGDEWILYELETIKQIVGPAKPLFTSSADMSLVSVMTQLMSVKCVKQNATDPDMLRYKSFVLDLDFVTDPTNQQGWRHQNALYVKTATDGTKEAWLFEPYPYGAAGVNPEWFPLPPAAVYICMALGMTELYRIFGHQGTLNNCTCHCAGFIKKLIDGVEPTKDRLYQMFHIPAGEKSTNINLIVPDWLN